MRDINLGRDTQPHIPHSVGMTEEQIYEMYRLLAIAKYEERYVIPTAFAPQARDLEEMGCSLTGEGGPGMYESEPIPVSVETFHALKRGETSPTRPGRGEPAQLGRRPGARRDVPRGAEAVRLLSALRERSTGRAMQDRLVWQAASLLLAYPDDGFTDRLDAVDEILGHISGPAATLLGQTARRCAPASRWPPRWTMSRRSTCAGAPPCT